MAAMLTLFVCLLLIDFTRSDRASPKQPAVNATSRSFTVDDRRSGAGRGPAPGQEQGRDQGKGTPAPRHRPHHPFQYAHPNLHNYPRMRDYGRSLKGQAADDQDDVPPPPPPPPASAEEEELPEHHILEKEDKDEDDDDWENEDSDESGSEGSESWEQDGSEREDTREDADDEDEEQYDEILPVAGVHNPPYPSTRLYRSLDLDDAPATVPQEHPTAPEDDTDAATAVQLDEGTPSGSDQGLSRAADDGVDVSGPSSYAADVPPTDEGVFHQSEGSWDVHADGREPSEAALPPQRLTAPPPAQGRSDDSRAVVLHDGRRAGAVALPFQGPMDLRWPGIEDRDRERWAELVRVQQQAVQARRAQQEAQRRYYAELGTIQGEQYMMPHYPAQQENLGPVLFPSATKQQPEMVSSHFVPKKLMKLMMTQQGGSGNGKPWTFLASPQPQANQNQNQYLVVNSKGVVIPHSVNFPDIVKTANYPQLQSYRNQQSNKNVQEIINYLRSKGMSYNKRAYALSGAMLKNKAANKVYGKPQQAQASDFDVFSFPRPEPYVKEMAALASEVSSAESGERPDSQYNGHAYIADPFHPYKPSDPTEINQMASSFDSDTSASASSERVRPYLDDVGEPFAPPPRHAYPAALLGHGPGRYGRFRNPLLQPGGPQYTEATFKPLGGDAPAQQASEPPSTAVGRGGVGLGAAKSVPPLSVMLEIFPMGEAKNKDGAATVMWNNFPVAALRPVIRRPPSTAPSLVPSLGASLGASVQQADASVRRPVLFPMDSASSAASSAASRFPVLMQGQLSAPGHTQPAFGVTLSGVQGLQALSGMPMLDSKHRMVVHLNFYPKKQMHVPMRFRDLSGADHTPQGATLIPGGTFPQRRQGVLEVADASPMGSVALDLAPLLQSLPLDIQRHLAAIVHTYQKPAAGGAGGAGGTARDDDADDFDDSMSDETEEDYAGDKSGEVADAKRHPDPTPRAPVDAEPSYAGSSSEESVGDVPATRADPNPIAQWLIGRDRPWAPPPASLQTKQQRKGASSAVASAPTHDRRKGSYFDVQDDVYDDDATSNDGERPDGDTANQDGVLEADKRLGHDADNGVLQQKRLQLWRYWKEMQALQALQKDREKKKRKRKKVSGRTQREDSYSFSAESLGDDAAAASAEQFSVPKNHRLE